jgi:hypothetical protein
MPTRIDTVIKQATRGLPLADKKRIRVLCIEATRGQSPDEAVRIAEEIAKREALAWHDEEIEQQERRVQLLDVLVERLQQTPQYKAFENKVAEYLREADKVIRRYRPKVGADYEDMQQHAHFKVWWAALGKGDKMAIALVKKIARDACRLFVKKQLARQKPTAYSKDKPILDEGGERRHYRIASLADTKQTDEGREMPHEAENATESLATRQYGQPPESLPDELIQIKEARDKVQMMLAHVLLGFEDGLERELALAQIESGLADEPFSIEKFCSEHPEWPKRTAQRAIKAVNAKLSRLYKP